MNEPLLTKLLVGTGSPLAGLAVSLSTYNEMMQAVSLTAGAIVAVLTGISIVRGWFKK